MLERLWRKGNPHSLLMGMQTGANTMENSVETSQKIRNRNPIQPSYPTTGYFSKELEINKTDRFMHPYVHCSIIHYNQGVEATQLPSN